MELKTEIYGKILGQAIRFVLRLVAGYLALVDVTAEDQGIFVEVTVQYVTPVLIYSLVELWSWLQKRFAAIREEKARTMKAFTSPLEVKQEAAAETSLPVSF